MQIRQANSEDVPAISKLLVQLSKDFIVGGFSKEGQENLLRSMSPEAISYYLDQGYRYHVAEQGGELAGVVATRDDSHLYHLFVAESAQGTGLARELWHTAKQDCLTRASPEWFTVNSSLNAQEVYKSWGFVPINGVREGGGVRDIPMKLRLDS